MKDYSKGKIYKIVADTNEDYDPYIGSTTKEYLSQRMTKHRLHYTQWKKGSKKQSTSSNIFERFGMDNCQIILLENYPCSSNDELVARERYWFDKIKNCNRCRPKISEEEVKEYMKKRYEKSKENPNFLKDQYQKKIERNPNEGKERYEKYKEQWKKYSSEKIPCEICEKCITKGNMSRHKKICKKE